MFEKILGPKTFWGSSALNGPIMDLFWVPKNGPKDFVHILHRFGGQEITHFGENRMFGGILVSEILGGFISKQA